MNPIELMTQAILASADCTNCPWMKYAIAELGVKEVPGEQDNPRVVEYLETVGYKKDSTAWCSAFVNWCMKCAGNERSIEEVTKKGASAAGAKSWLLWGIPLAAPRFGAVSVFHRTDDPALGHVGFYVGSYADQILLLGGNQRGNPRDEVNVSLRPKKLLINHRWSAKTFGGEKWV